MFCCAPKATNNKPLEMNESKLDGMTVDELRATAIKLKAVIIAKMNKYSEIEHKLGFDETTPTTPNLIRKVESYFSTIEGKDFGEWIDSLISDMLQLEVYRQKLKEKGGDTSDLDNDNIRIKNIILPPLRQEELPPELKLKEPA
jgi:hypothetical protein